MHLEYLQETETTDQHEMHTPVMAFALALEQLHRYFVGAKLDHTAVILDARGHLVPLPPSAVPIGANLCSENDDKALLFINTISNIL